MINQTTLSFLELEQIHQEIRNRLPNARFYDEICDATLLRQIAIQKLDSGVDTIIIVGSNKSSNTMKLYDIATKVHPDKQVVLIKDVNELKEKKLRYNNVVIASGTSTPYQTIEQIKKYLESN